MSLGLSFIGISTFPGSIAAVNLTGLHFMFGQRLMIPAAPVNLSARLPGAQAYVTGECKGRTEGEVLSDRDKT